MTKSRDKEKRNRLCFPSCGKRAWFLGKREDSRDVDVPSSNPPAVKKELYVFPLVAGRISIASVSQENSVACFVLDGLKDMSKGIWGNHLFTPKYVGCFCMPSGSDETMTKTENAFDVRHVS